MVSSPPGQSPSLCKDGNLTPLACLPLPHASQQDDFTYFMGRKVHGSQSMFKNTFLSLSTE